MLRRSNLLLFESDAEFRAAERRVRKDPSDVEARRTYARWLRRQDRTREADLHDLHALGHERATAHDHESEMMQRRNAAHKVLKAARGGDERKHAEAHAAFKEAHARYREASQAHGRAAEAWHDLAKRVHAAGDNPGLAYHKPRRQSAADHRDQLVNHIANRNQVKHDAEEHPGHLFWSRAGSTKERRAAVDRAAREAHEALQQHHPDTEPELGAMLHGYGGRTQRLVRAEPL